MEALGHFCIWFLFSWVSLTFQILNEQIFPLQMFSIGHSWEETLDAKSMCFICGFSRLEAEGLLGSEHSCHWGTEGGLPWGGSVKWITVAWSTVSLQISGGTEKLDLSG